MNNESVNRDKAIPISQTGFVTHGDIGTFTIYEILMFCFIYW